MLCMQTMKAGIDARAAAAGATAAGIGSVDAAVIAIVAAVGLMSPPRGKPRDLGLPALAARLAEAAAGLEASGRVDVMPLVYELEVTAEWLAANGAGRDARAAVSTALDILLARLHGDAGDNGNAILLAAIVNLRSVRKASLLLSVLPPGSDGSPASKDGVLSHAVARRLLPAFRTGLVGLLRDRCGPATTMLANACRDAGAEPAAGPLSRRWRLAAEIFDRASAPAAADLRIAVTRLAARLESFLRGACAPESEIHPGEGTPIWRDVEVLHALMIRLEGEDTAARSAEAGLETNRTACSRQAVTALKNGARLAEVLRGLRDALLREARYERWCEILKLEQDGADRETVLRRLAAWEASPATAAERERPVIVPDHLAGAGTALERPESEAIGAAFAPEPASPEGVKTSPDPPDFPTSPIAVDEALLEDLNCSAAEIRGARSRAEANLGSLRGGLQKMAHTIKSLRTRLEALELDLGTAAGAETCFADRQNDGASSGLGALSRGIEALQGLQEALNALTEETESVLALQAREDRRLEHDLLKTRLVPVSTQFKRWTGAVSARAGVRLDIHGGEPMLERRQAAALSNALIPLLEACVAGGGQIAMDISRPKFDLILRIHFPGAPIASEAWRGFCAAFEKLGAIAVQQHEGSETMLRIVVPGPPQSLDVLLVELGGQRFALPVDGVAGVVQPAQGVPAGVDGESLSAAERRSLAALLGFPEAPAPSGCGPAVLLLPAAESRQPVACCVDAVLGRERMLARSPGILLANNPWLLAVILNEHAPPTLVLDLPALVRGLIAEIAAA